MVLHSEEDVKAKVVSEWLINHGFGPQDISLERTFELRFGRAILTVGSTATTIRRARCDYLVRAHDGRNLMIVEVKAPDERIDEDVKEQGISYARALRHGGIAPFVVLTNGQDTQIYDSITGQLLNGLEIPLDHPHVRSGFRYSGDDLLLRAEALHTLLSLSTENLLAFCKDSVAQHMSLLRSDDSMSGKKYIPKLYIDRTSAADALRKMLTADRLVTLVTGLPQVGKTNFLCRFVEDMLARGEPCLFFPAISMKTGLIEELKDDFQWTFGDSSSAFHIAQKFHGLLSRCNQRLLIVIDGWNEAERELANTFNADFQRLASAQIRFLVSFTNIASRRLLVDEVNNTGFVADTVGITRDVVPLLEVQPDKLEKAVVVERYSVEEMDIAYETYAREYQVKVPAEHKQTRDPFLLGIAMRMYQGGLLPVELDEPLIIARNLECKSERAGGFDAGESERSI